MRRLLSILILCAPLAAAADPCPTGPWPWVQADATGDDWVSDLVCVDWQTREAITNHVVTHMGLDENWSYWDQMLVPIGICNENYWGGRAINGGWAIELVGIQRDNSSLAHTQSPTISLNGQQVAYWLAHFVSDLVSSEGFKWGCLASSDPDPFDNSMTFGSNPAGNSACSVYFPWFFQSTPFGRAATVVHEAMHEIEGHISDTACPNGASCDDAWMNPNAQTVHTVFLAQAVDAYQRAPGSTDLQVVGFGDGSCGYLPLMPEGERAQLSSTIATRLNQVFATMPPVSSWPKAAFVDPSPGGVWGTEPVQRVDLFNGARWPCGAVCDPADFAFPNGQKACNEAFWPVENAAVNAANQQHCADLNAQAANGVTPAQHQQLVLESFQLTSCKSGVSQGYLDALCDTLIPGASHVDDIANTWPLQGNLGYGYIASQAIEACQVRFCGAQDLDAWAQSAGPMCYAWDDAAGCMELLCGDLGAIEAQHGLASVEYLVALACRASELGREIPGLRHGDLGCDKVFNDCIVEERYLDAWHAQLDGGPCWSAAIPKDPLYAGSTSAHFSQHPQAHYLPGGGAFDLTRSECLVREAECEAHQAALLQAGAMMLEQNAAARPPWTRGPGPDPWLSFDLDLEQQLMQLAQAPLEGGPLNADARLRKAGSLPEARVALAELIGLDHFLQAGGALRHAEIFAPDRLARFASGEEADPYALPTGELADQLEALQTLHARLTDRTWEALRRRAGALSAERYVAHVAALLNARDAVALLAAHDLLQQDLAALR